MLDRLTAAALFVCAAGGALAQTAPFQMPRADDPPPAAETPHDAPARGLDGLLNDLLDSAQPHLEGLARDLGGVVEDYAPMLDQLGNVMDDIGNYELPPERLPNGDILIRRKAGAPPPPALDQVPGLMPHIGPPDEPLVIDPDGPAGTQL